MKIWPKVGIDYSYLVENENGWFIQINWDIGKDGYLVSIQHRISCFYKYLARLWTCCAKNAQRIKELDELRVNLTHDNNWLEEQNEKLQAENQRLEIENEKIDKIKRQIVENLCEIEDKVDELQTRNQALEAELKYKEDVVKLAIQRTEEYKQMKADPKESKITICVYEDRIQALEAENLRLLNRLRRCVRICCICGKQIKEGWFEKHNEFFCSEKCIEVYNNDMQKL